MTVTSQTTKVTGNGTGAATVFSFSPIVLFDTDEIEVTLVAADGTETLLVEGSSSTTYSVAAAANSYPSASGETGSVTYPASGGTPIASGVSLVMKRILTLEQQTDLENQGGYNSETQEAQFDKGIMIDLQQQEEIDRTLKVPLSDSVVSLALPDVDDRKSNTFIWDASGVPGAGAATTTAVSAAMSPVVTAATTAAGLAALISGNAVEFVEGAAVASAATTDIWAGDDGNTVHVTGTTTITSLGTAPAAGAWRYVIFDGALTLTDGANLNLPNSTNITTAADDIMFVYAETTTLFKVVYFPEAGLATSMLADNSVTLAKMAGGTDGNLITYDASGDPAAVATGTVAQLLKSAGAGAAPTFSNLWTTAASIDLTSGSPTAVTLASGLSGVQTIEIYVDGGSTNTNNQALMVQIGDSGGFETTGYSGIGAYTNASTIAFETISTGFVVGEDTNVDAAGASEFFMRLHHMGSDVWTCEATGALSTVAGLITCHAIRSALDSELTQVRITTTGGSATFDGGTAYVRYQ